MFSLCRWMGLVYLRMAQKPTSDVIVQRASSDSIRNSIKYVPSKDFKTYTSHLKKVYGVPSLKTCQAEFEKFQHA